MNTRIVLRNLPALLAVSLTIRLRAALLPEADRERGDVPGWVMITLMSAVLVAAILTSRPHPEQGYRACLGILRLERQYGAERLEAACDRGLDIGARSYGSIQSILKNGLDRRPRRPSSQAELLLPDHPNLRGPRYYH